MLLTRSDISFQSTVQEAGAMGRWFERAVPSRKINKGDYYHIVAVGDNERWQVVSHRL